mmetsp:Transcript_53418/g.122755  ORF Transcript_53418/g.122755 Transcript_53418/m.122755 type:complete len:255 (-) Transcript_53418:322-1086(-)
MVRGGQGAAVGVALGVRAPRGRQPRARSLEEGQLARKLAVWSASCPLEFSATPTLRADDDFLERLARAERAPPWWRGGSPPRAAVAPIRREWSRRVLALMQRPSSLSSLFQSSGRGRSVRSHEQLSLRAEPPSAAVPHGEVVAASGHEGRREGGREGRRESMRCGGAAYVSTLHRRSGGSCEPPRRARKRCGKPGASPAELSQPPPPLPAGASVRPSKGRGAACKERHRPAPAPHLAKLSSGAALHGESIAQRN